MRDNNFYRMFAYQIHDPCGCCMKLETLLNWQQKVKIFQYSFVKWKVSQPSNIKLCNFIICTITMNYFIVHDYMMICLFFNRNFPLSGKAIESVRCRERGRNSDRHGTKAEKSRNEQTENIHIKNMKYNLPCFVGMFRRGWKGKQKQQKNRKIVCLSFFSVAGERSGSIKSEVK